MPPSVQFLSDVSATFVQNFYTTEATYTNSKIIYSVSDVSYGSVIMSDSMYYYITFNSTFNGNPVSLTIETTSNSVIAYFPYTSTFSTIEASYDYSMQNNGTNFLFYNISVKMTNGTLYTGSLNQLNITNEASSQDYYFSFIDSSGAIISNVLSFSGGGANPSVFTWSGDNLDYPPQQFYLDFFFGIYTILAQVLSSNPNIDYISIGTVFTCPLLTSSQIYK